MAEVRADAQFPEPAATGYLCYLADGLFCDLGTGCAARRGPGGACLGNESCADTAFCDYTLAGGTCVARKPADAHCVGEDECAKGYYCKSSTGAECLSALCDNSACGEGPGSQLAFICGGT